MYSDYYYGNEMDYFTGAVFFGVIIALIVFGLIAYVISAFIFYRTAKTNGFDDAAYISWIPVANVYMLFLLSANGVDDVERRAYAKKWFWIYLATILLSWIPIIGWILSIASLVIAIYAYYRLYYRWTAEKNKSILYDVLTMVSGGIFFMIYGLMRMNQPFKA